MACGDGVREHYLLAVTVAIDPMLVCAVFNASSDAPVSATSTSSVLVVELGLKVIVYAVHAVLLLHVILAGVNPALVNAVNNGATGSLVSLAATVKAIEVGHAVVLSGSI